MPSIKKEYIEARVERLKMQFTIPVVLDWLQGKPRIGISTNRAIKKEVIAANIDRYISPRLTRSQFVTWLDGFEEGLELIRTQNDKFRGE